MKKPGLAVMIAAGDKAEKEDDPYELGALSPEEEEEGSGGCEACLEEAFAAVQSGDKEGFMSAMRAALDAYSME